MVDIVEVALEVEVLVEVEVLDHHHLRLLVMEEHVVDNHLTIVNS